MRTILLILLLLFNLLSCTDDLKEAYPPVLYETGMNHFQQVFDSLENELKVVSAGLLELDPLSVTNKQQIPEGIDPRSYLSMACYWWPDPGTENGLPYIRKDGQVNPETRSDNSDLPKMIEMAKRVEFLSLSFMTLQDEVYAHKAIELLYYWFINEKTAMLPHLEYAQMVKGRNTGRSFGIIDTWWLVRVVEGTTHLKDSKYWTSEVEYALKEWFSDYVQWLYHSEFGRKENRSKNNHGTWYDVQLVTFAYFSGDHDLAKHHLEEVSRRRIPRQISIMGRQRYETRRPRPVHYSIYNLSGLIKLAEFGEKLGVAVKDTQRFYSGNLEIAINYLMKMVQDVHFSDILDPLDLTDTDLLYLDLLASAWHLFGRQEYMYEMIRVSDNIENAKLPLLKDREIWRQNL